MILMDEIYQTFDFQDYGALFLDRAFFLYVTISEVLAIYEP